MKSLLSLLLLAVTLFARSSFLMPDQAFIPSVEAVDANHLKAHIELGDKIYTYKDKLKVKVEGKDIAIRSLKLPTAHDHEGSMIFSKSPDIFITLEKLKNISGTIPVKVTLNFQGCSEMGLCYEPMQKTFVLTIDASKLPLHGEKIAKKIAKKVAKSSSETDSITQTFIEGNVGVILLTFFGFGLLLALTPCIFPMIPILSSIIVSQGEGMNAKRGFILSLVYVLSMSVAYTTAGVLAGLFGANIQVAMQNPWVISTFSLLFVILAFSMFGFFEIGLPASLQSKLSRTSDAAGSKGGFIGVAIMGFLSALIVGPCVAPPLAGALVYIGQTGDALLGGAALFVLSLGMGVPLLLIGIGAGKFMPRPGGWMMQVSKVFGVVMLGIAIWMLSRIISEQISMLLWSFLLLGSAVFMGALEPLKDRAYRYAALVKSIAVIFFIYGLFLFYGAMSGATNPLNPFEGTQTKAGTQNATKVTQLHFKKIHSIDELQQALADAKGKKVMLDFYADWCISCKELEHTTFKDAGVIDALKNYTLLQADVTKNSEDEKALTKMFGLYGPPGIIFFKNGKELEGKKLIGFKDTKTFLEHIESIK